MWVPKWYFEAQERNVKDLERRVNAAVRENW